MASETLAANTRGLRRVRRTTLLPAGGCTLKMARSHSHEQHYHRQDHYILRNLFAPYGLPEELISDNGPPISALPLIQ